MIGTTFCFLREAHPDTFDLDGYAALKQHSKTCDALPEFRNAYQAFRLG